MTNRTAPPKPRLQPPPRAACFTLLALLCCSPSLRSQTCAPSPTNLVGWWRAEGDAQDSAGSNPGILEGGIAFASGQVGQAFTFNGVDADVYMPASPTLDVGAGSGFTIDAWINPADLNERPIIEWNTGSDFQAHFWYSFAFASPGTLYLNLKEPSTQDHSVVSPPGLIQAGVFQHVAATYDKSSGLATLYVNGAIVTQTNVGSFTPNTTADLYLGLRPGGGGAGRRFQGLMDEVDVFSRALSPAEVQAIYNAGTAGKCTGPPAILIPPQSFSVRPGTNISFSVTVSGFQPLTYRWQLNGADIPDATNSSLSLTNVQPVNAGDYSVIVSNSLGVVTSPPATLSVNVVLAFANGQPLTNAQTLFGGPVTVQLQNVYGTNAYTFYTLDGSTPTFASTFYTNSFIVTQSVVLRALGYSVDFLNSGLAGPFGILLPPKYVVTGTTAGGGIVSLLPTNGPYLSNTVVTVTATPASGWRFLQWLGDASGTNTTANVLMNRPKSVQAVFGTTLGATAAGGGSVALNPPGGVYPFGTSVQLIAIPQSGNFFVFWGNAAGGNTNPLTFLLTNANPTVSSLFASLSAGQVALTVVPLGHGTVFFNPHANTYGVGQVVTVTATPNPGQSFLGWSGDASGTQNPLSVTLTQSKTIYANFTLNHTLTAHFGPGGTNDGLILDLNGEFGTAYQFSACTNLLDWTNLFQLTNSVGTIHFIDSAATNFSRRYYRAVPVP